MISLARRSLRICCSPLPSGRQTSRVVAEKQHKLPIVFHLPAFSSSSLLKSQRFFSSSSSDTQHQQQQQQQQLSPDDPQVQFQPTPPTELNMEMARGIQASNHLILKHGVGRQRLELLSKESDTSMPLVIKWQRMMEIYLGAQLHVVASLGYQTDESGIMMYTQQLAQFVGTKCDPSTQDEFRAKGRETWREMLTIAFGLDKEMIAEKYGNELSIVEARNIVHKVASALIEPNILEEVATRVSLTEGMVFFCGRFVAVAVRENCLRLRVFCVCDRPSVIFCAVFFFFKSNEKKSNKQIVATHNK